MNILFVSVLLNPLNIPINGDAQRTQLLLKACAAVANVDLVTFAGKAQSEGPIIEGVNIVSDEKIPCSRPVAGKLRKWVTVLPSTNVNSLFPVVPEWEAKVDSIIQSGEYDLIVTRYFPRAMACGLWKYHDRLVVDFDDALPFFFLNQLTSDSALTTKIRLNMAARKAERMARRSVKQMHAAFFAEETVARTNHAVFLPNTPYYGCSCPDADMSMPTKRIVFVGQLEYEPNKEGLDYFLEKVYLPLIQRLPNVEMHVVGYINDEALRRRWESYPNVTVTGFVDDLRLEYVQSHVAVVPIHRCGGTNIKLLEALAMNRACVTTVEAQSKMSSQFVNGRDLVAAADDKEYVEALVTLLTDEKENQRIAHNGKSVMDQYYSFDAFCDIVKKAIV